VSLPSGWWDTSASPDYEDIKKEPTVSGASSSFSLFTDDDGVDYTRHFISGCGFVSAAGGRIKAGETNNMTGSKEFGMMWVYDPSGPGYYYTTDSLHLNSAATYYGDGESLLYWPFDDAASIINIAASRGSAGTARFFMPDCWLGTVAEVSGAIMMEKGLDVDYVDTAAWSAADDGHKDYGSGSDTLSIFYRREPGRTYGDTLKAIARHSWDILFINMKCQISMISRESTTATHIITGLDLDDGVISVQWRMASEHIGNWFYVGYGRWSSCDREWVYAAPSTYPLHLKETDAGVPTKYEELWELYENAASQALHGVRKVGNNRAVMYSGRDEEEVTAFYLPYLTQPDPDASASVAEASRDEFMERRGIEGAARREITTVQNFRGLDYDVGYKITGTDLTGEDGTITVTCIKKTVDFKDFTVTSVLLQEFN